MVSISCRPISLPIQEALCQASRPPKNSGIVGWGIPLHQENEQATAVTNNDPNNEASSEGEADDPIAVGDHIVTATEDPVVAPEETVVATTNRIAVPEPTSQHPMRTRLKNNIRQIKEFKDGTMMYSYVAQICEIEPSCHVEALKNKNWRQAIENEYDALIRNETWNLVQPKQGMNLIDCK
ncbi:Retrovirus-related Pol polyprotein from transposon RE2-like protein [Drosera capensis]